MQERFRVSPDANKVMEDTTTDFQCLCYNEMESEELVEFLNQETRKHKNTFNTLIEYAAFVLMIEEYTDAPILTAVWDAGNFKRNQDFNDQIHEFRKKAEDKFKELK